jgi:hypothetical protein
MGILPQGDDAHERPTRQALRERLSSLTSRTAVYVIRTYGGLGGPPFRGGPIPICMKMMTIIRSWPLLLAVCITSCVTSTSPSLPPAQYSHLRRLPPLDHSKLQLFDPDDVSFRDVRDPTNGVFFYRTVAKATEQLPTESMNRVTAPDADGVVWYEQIDPLTNGTEVLRFRLTPETLRHIVIDQNLPVSPRYVALRELPQSKISHQEHMSLFEMATRDPSPSVRYIALCWPPRLDQEVVPIYARALTDPVVRNGLMACGPLLKFFSLQDESKELLTAPCVGSAPPAYWYLPEYLDVRRVAHRIHAICPELVTSSDLRGIERLRVPSTEWWKHEYEEDYSAARKDYVRGLLKQYEENAEQESGHVRK